MKTVTAAFEAALRSPSIRLAFLAEIHDAGGPNYFWSGAGTLSYDGRSWVGVGRLGRVRGAGESTEVVTQETEYSLLIPYIDSALADFAAEDVRGGTAKTWLALLDDNEAVIADPLLIDESVIDRASVSVDSATLVLTGQSALFNFGAASRVAYTNEQQQGDFSGDTGFDRIQTEVVDREIRWTL